MALSTITADYKIDISNGQSTAIYTTPNEIKSWTLESVSEDKHPTDLILEGTILKQTLADNTILTVDLTSIAGEALTPISLSFNQTSNILTLTLNNNTTLVSNLSELDTKPASLSFDTNTLVLSLTNSDATSIATDLSFLENTDTTVSSGVFDITTNNLTLTNSDATTVDISLNSLISWYSIGASNDIKGVFDIRYTTSDDLIIPSTNGDVMIMLDVSASGAPSSISLPDVTTTPIGWECNILVYDSEGSAQYKTLAAVTTDSILNDITDPLSNLTLGDPYGSLTSTVNLESGHFYRIKKVNSTFFLVHYA